MCGVSVGCYLVLLTTELQRAFFRRRDEHTAVSAALDRATPPLRNLLLQPWAHLQIRLRCWDKKRDEWERMRYMWTERCWCLHLKIKFMIMLKNVNIRTPSIYSNGLDIFNTFSTGWLFFTWLYTVMIYHATISCYTVEDGFPFESRSS